MAFEPAFDGEQRRLQVERVEGGLGYQNVHATREQTAYLLMVGRGQSVECDRATGRVVHIGDNLVLVKETYVDFAGEQSTKDVEMRIRRSQGG